MVAGCGVRGGRRLVGLQYASFRKRRGKGGGPHYADCVRNDVFLVGKICHGI